MENWIKIKTNQFSTYHFNKYIKQSIIEMYFDDRLYWLDRTILKSSTTTGTDIKSHIITNGATDVFLYKVICYKIVFGNSLSKIWPSIIKNDFFFIFCEGLFRMDKWRQTLLFKKKNKQHHRICSKDNTKHKKCGCVWCISTKR